MRRAGKKKRLAKKPWQAVAGQAGESAPLWTLNSADAYTLNLSLKTKINE